jgi:hypothetical protein
MDQEEEYAMSDPIDEFHAAVLGWADHLGLEGDEREEYVSFHMDKGGYKKATTWLPPDPDEGGKEGGSMFSKGRRKPGQAPGGSGGGGGKTPQQYFGGKK